MMSAFLLQFEHIHYLLMAGLKFVAYRPLAWYPPVPKSDEPRRQVLDYLTADRVGQMLVLENLRSWAYRYNGSSKINDDELYKHSPSNLKLDPVQILKAIDCYEYQSCEHPEWEDSEAKSFCEALRRATIAVLPGYDEALWDIPDRLPSFTPVEDQVDEGVA